MTINTKVKKLQEMVDKVVLRIKNIETLCNNAKDNLGSDYSFVLSIPAVTSRFVTEITDMASDGYTTSVLGPTMDATYGTDWANEEADYNLLKVDLPVLSQWVIDNADLFVLTLDSDGNKLYTTAIISEKEAELSLLLDTVISRFN